MSDYAQRIQEHFLDVAKVRSAELESLIAEAVALQDFDKLDRLCLVDRTWPEGVPTTVASWVNPWGA